MRENTDVGNDLVKLMCKYTGMNAEKIIITKAVLKCEVNEPPSINMEFYIK